MKECCQNGCNNCVLDQIPISETATGHNLLHNGAYLKYKVISIEKCTDSVYRLGFQLLDAEYENTVQELGKCFCIDIPPGWHMSFRARKLFKREPNPLLASFSHPKICDDARTNSEKEQHDPNTEDWFMSRPYTPINVDKTNLCFEILVKLEPNGKMSRYIQTLFDGDIVEWKGPYGELSLGINSYANLIGFSHGVALAPLFSVANSILTNKTEETKIHLITCFASLCSILLRKEVNAMKKFWNFNATTYVAKELCSVCENRDCCKRPLLYKENVLFRRLAEKDILHIMEKLQTDSTLILICGTSRFSQFIKNYLLSLGFNKFHVF